MTTNVQIRFRVLVRDGFTCQYCGRKPPEIILEVDHIIPKVHPSKTDDSEDNLITACRDCNLGKSNTYVDKSIIPKYKDARNNNTS